MNRKAIEYCNFFKENGTYLEDEWDSDSQSKKKNPF